MSDYHQPCNPARSRRSQQIVLLALVAVISVLATGCFTFRQNKTYAIGTEANRANIVVHVVPTHQLVDLAQAKGYRAARNAVASQVPSRIEIRRIERAAICAVSLALCLSADQIGRMIASWFKDDIRNRGDFREALDAADARNRCFAWTFVPRRNLTHKGVGTSSCRQGA